MSIKPLSVLAEAVAEVVASVEAAVGVTLVAEATLAVVEDTSLVVVGTVEVEEAMVEEVTVVGAIKVATVVAAVDMEAEAITEVVDTAAVAVAAAAATTADNRAAEAEDSGSHLHRHHHDLHIARIDLDERDEQQRERYDVPKSFDTSYTFLISDPDGRSRPVGAIQDPHSLF